MSTSNLLAWVDIPVSDLHRAITFYSAVLAAEVRREGGPGSEVGVLPHTKGSLPSYLTAMEDNQPSLHGPLIYLSVQGRLAEACDAVRRAGGQVVQEPHQIGGSGNRAIIVDCEGNRLALHSQ